MKVKKRNLTVYGFFIGILIVVYGAVTLNLTVESESKPMEAKVIEKTHFQNALYYVLKNNKPSFFVKASNIDFFGNSEIELKNPIGVLYKEESKTDFKSLFGYYNSKKLLLELKDEVDVTEPKASYKGDFLQYRGGKKEIEARGNVKTTLLDQGTGDKLFINSDSLLGEEEKEQVSFKGNVEGKLARKKRYEEGLAFSSEQVFYDGKKSLLELLQNVKIKRANTLISSNKGEIFLENFNKKLKYYVLYDDIKLEEEIRIKNETIKRKAFAEKLEGFVSEEKILLTGAPRIEQGSDVVKGYEIILRENSEIIEIFDSQSNFKMKNKEGE